MKQIYKMDINQYKEIKYALYQNCYVSLRLIQYFNIFKYYLS